MTRKQKIAKIRRWLSKNGLSVMEVHAGGPLTKAPDEILDSIIADNADDDARSQHALLEQSEAYENIED